MEDRDRYDEKLVRILQGAARVFADKGYHQASVRDISAATGVSLSGLYYYVKSKEELLFLIQRRCFETLLETVGRDLDGVEDPREGLRILIGNHLAFFVRNMAEMKVLSHDADALTGDYDAAVRKLKRAYAARVEALLTGFAPARGAVHSRIATFSLFGMMNWIYTWYRTERDVPVDRLARDMTHLFLHGYETPVPGVGPAAAGGDATDTPSIWRSG